VGLALLIGAVAGCATSPPELSGKIEKASGALQEVVATPETGIPREWLSRAQAVAVFPGVVKAAFFFGGRWGEGVMSVRKEPGRNDWSPPAFVFIGGGSFGLQIGGEVTDLVLLVMSQRGVDSLLRSKVTLGADLSVAAGPVGRQASAATDLRFGADILSYSRTKGFFAGISLEGATIQADDQANQALYGRGFTAGEILLSGRVPSPPQAQPLLRTLGTYAAATGG
jgi:lipid-binding SYLF domain-containing protein